MGVCGACPSAPNRGGRGHEVPWPLQHQDRCRKSEINVGASVLSAPTHSAPSFVSRSPKRPAWATTRGTSAIMADLLAAKMRSEKLARGLGAGPQSRGASQALLQRCGEASQLREATSGGGCCGRPGACARAVRPRTQKVSAAGRARAATATRTVSGTVRATHRGAHT